MPWTGTMGKCFLCAKLLEYAIIHTMNVTITLLLCSRSINKIYKQNLNSLFLCFLTSNNIFPSPNPALLPIRNYHIFRPGMIQRVKFTEYISLNTSLNLHIN